MGSLIDLHIEYFAGTTVLAGCTVHLLSLTALLPGKRYLKNSVRISTKKEPRKDRFLLSESTSKYSISEIISEESSMFSC